MPAIRIAKGRIAAVETWATFVSSLFQVIDLVVLSYLFRIAGMARSYKVNYTFVAKWGLASNGCGSSSIRCSASSSTRLSSSLSHFQ